jgi:hypothetical protein
MDVAAADTASCDPDKNFSTPRTRDGKIDDVELLVFGKL